jgi:hypothetical protein
MHLIRAIALSLAVLLPQAGQASPEFWAHEWPDTDFSNTSVQSWVEILSGGPPKDGIPALDDPAMGALAQTDVAGNEPVIAVEIEGEAARAYPLRYLMWHEIVNDRIGVHPVAVTWCPLCNSALVFDRRTEAGVLSFGVTGKLRFSDMVMYDRETQSWWQQTTGRGIVGEMTGTELTTLPVWVESLDTFAARNPDGLVMEEPDWPRAYGRNPYRGYDTAPRPFLYSGAPPPHGIAPLARVVRVGARAWPLDRLAEARRIEEAGTVLSWEGTAASPLDTDTLSQGREVGMIRVRDTEGHDLAHDVIFAFVFDAFWPDGVWMLAPDDQ